MCEKHSRVVVFVLFRFKVRASLALHRRRPLTGPRAGLHDHVPAELLPRRQKVRQSRATQPICTALPDWVPTSPVQTHLFCDSSRFNFKCHGRQLVGYSARCNLGGGRVGLGRGRSTRPRRLTSRGENLAASHCLCLSQSQPRPSLATRGRQRLSVACTLD